MFLKNCHLGLGEQRRLGQETNVAKGAEVLLILVQFDNGMEVMHTRINPLLAHKKKKRMPAIFLPRSFCPSPSPFTPATQATVMQAILIHDEIFE